MSATASRMSRIRKVLLWLAGLFVLLVVAGYFIVPPVARSVIVSQAGKALGREVSIDAIAVNPFALSATVTGFRLMEKDSQAVFASVQQVHLNLESSSLWNLAPVISQLRFANPQVSIVRLPGGRFNFTDILDALAARPKAKGTTRFSLNNIELSGGRVDIDDRVQQAQHAITDIRLAVPFLSNLPAMVDVKVTPAFAARFNETTIDLKGETVPFLDTMQSSLQLSFTDLALGRYLRYVPATLAFDIASGALSSELRLSFIRAQDRQQRLTLSGTAQVRDLSVVDTAGAPLLSVPLVEVDIESIDVFSRDIDVSRIAVKGLDINAVRARDGSINLLALALAPRPVPSGPAPAPSAGAVAPAAPAAPAPPAQSAPSQATPPAPAVAPAETPLRFAFTEILLSGGRLAFTDRTLAQPFRAELSSIDVAVKSLSNKGREPATATASMRSALGETMTASVTVELAPAAVEGTIELSGLRPRNYAPYYGPFVRFEIIDARVDAKTAFRMGTDRGRMIVSLSGFALDVADLRTRRTGEKEPLLDVRRLALTGLDVDLARRTATLGELLARDGLLRVDRNKDGQVNLAMLMAASADTPSTADSTPDGPPPAAAAVAAAPLPAWTWAIKRAAIERWSVRWFDRVPAEAVAVEMSDIAASVEGLDNSKGSRASVALKMAINRTGSLSVKGQFALDPALASLDVDAQSISILPFQPYFTDRLNLVVTGGDLSVKGAASADSSVQPLRASFAGEANIANFAALERANNEELLRWKSLFFGGIEVTAAPTRVAVRQIALSEFFARVILSEKGRLNLLDLAVNEPAAAGAAPSAAAAAASGTAGQPAAAARPGTAAASTTASTTAAPPSALPFPITIGSIALASGNIYFSDLFVRPNYRVNLTGMTGAVSALTSDPGTAADVELRGQLDGTAPVEILGRMNPLANPLFIDIKAAIRGAELSTLSPYSTRYTGYGIERGRLTMNVAYRVEGRKVAAEHRIFLDQLTFSTERIEGPSVVKLPLLFAVRLLQNRRGEIDLNLPISGTLDDPQFRIGPIIWQVLGNLITRAVTAPFALLASLGGGTAEELSTVEFEPGMATLSDTARKRLATLGKALADRPALRLELSAGVDLVTDMEGYRRLLLDTAVRAQKARALARKGEAVASIEQVKLDPKEYETYLRATYGEARFAKPRNAVGLLRELPVPEMETLMLTHTQVTPEQLRELALARARAVEAFLVKNASVSPERIFLVTAQPGTADEKAKISAARVDMAIR